MRGRVVVGYYEYDLNLISTENYVTIGGVIHQYDIIFIKWGIKIIFFSFEFWFVLCILDLLLNNPQ